MYLPITIYDKKEKKAENKNIKQNIKSQREEIKLDGLSPPCVNR